MPFPWQSLRHLRFGSPKLLQTHFSTSACLPLRAISPKLKALKQLHGWAAHLTSSTTKHSVPIARPTLPMAAREHAQRGLQRRWRGLAGHQRHGAAPLAALAHRQHQQPPAALGHLWPQEFDRLLIFTALYTPMHARTALPVTSAMHCR